MDKNTVADAIIRIGDSSLIMGQRLSEWCGHGPFIEEDIALTNLALDYIGQTQLFYDYAAELRGKNESHDDLAFMRDGNQFKNFLLVELPNGDFAVTVGKICFFSGYLCAYYEALSNSADDRLAEIAVKSLKEVRYHFEHTSNWIVRLGQGTEESKRRMQDAIDQLWNYTFEMFEDDQMDADMNSLDMAPLPSSLHAGWDAEINACLQEAGLRAPEDHYAQKGGKSGVHTEHLGHLLAEMQFLQRAYPGNEW